MSFQRLIEPGFHQGILFLGLWKIFWLIVKYDSQEYEPRSIQDRTEVEDSGSEKDEGLDNEMMELEEEEHSDKENSAVSTNDSMSAVNVDSVHLYTVDDGNSTDVPVNEATSGIDNNCKDCHEVRILAWNNKCDSLPFFFQVNLEHVAETHSAVPTDDSTSAVNVDSVRLCAGKHGNSADVSVIEATSGIDDNSEDCHEVRTLS